MSTKPKQVGNLGKISDVEFNMEDDRVSLSNIMVSGKLLLPQDVEVSVNSGISAMHARISMSKLINESLVLVKGQLRELIAGLISQLGYTPTEDMVEETYADVDTVLTHSLGAHALLLKIWQVLNGRQATDVNGRYISNALFQMSQSLTLFADGVTIPAGTIRTEVDENISNAVWLQDYVNQLTYTYTTASARAVVASLFAPVFPISQGITSKTSYANLWPIEVADQNNSLTTQFKSRINLVRAVTARNPFVVQVLSYMGLETGSEFDYTRALDQKRLILAEDSSLIELLAANTISAGTENEEKEENKYPRRLLFLQDDTPISVAPFASLSIVSLYNMLRFNISWFNFNYMSIVTTKSGVIDNGTVIEPMLLNYQFLSTDPTTLDLVNKLNRKVIWQHANIDFDSCFIHSVYVEGLNRLGTDEIIAIGGYGTYVLDQDSADLALRASSTAVIFGADYETGFNNLLNAIPTNIIKFK